MPTPKKGYFLKDGRRVPGTTTVINRFKDSGGLIYWAWNEGKEGRDYRETSGKAADAGTLAHAMVEAQIKGKPAPDLATVAPEIAVKASTAFGAYIEWASQSKLEIMETEIELVSEKYEFGGTPDGIGYLNGRLSVIDWKSSNAVYSDHLVQMAAYSKLWEENRPGYPILGGFHLCRFAKEHGDFAHHYFPNLDEAWEQFVLFRRAYEIDKGLKKRAA